MKTSVLVAVMVGFAMLVPAGIVSAMPLDWEWEEYDPPPGEEPPEELPPLPGSGHYTTDSPSASYYLWHNAANSFMVKQRGGGIAYVWDEYGYPYEPCYVGGAYYADILEDYGWPYQTMPLGNATIQDVSLIVNLTTPNGPYHVGLQYSLDGSNWKPDFNTHPEYAFDINSPFSYRIYAFNVTTTADANETWTPQILLNPSFGVRLITIDEAMYYDRMLYVDYVGLRYNWTVVGTPPSSPLWDLPNSTLIGLGWADLIIGGMGFVGFAGMIVMPMVGIWAWRTQEDRIHWMFKVFVGIVFSFCVFIASLGV